MEDYRQHATSALDENGNFWMLGGVSRNRRKVGKVIFQSSLPASEVHDWKSKKWLKKQMPEELQQGGIYHHCSVQLNSTHVMMAGGLQGGSCNFDENDPDNQKGANKCDAGSEDGAVYSRKAYIFNGETWKEIAPMLEPRSSAACSVVPSDDSVSKIVQPKAVDMKSTMSTAPSVDRCRLPPRASMAASKVCLSITLCLSAAYAPKLWICKVLRRQRPLLKILTFLRYHGPA